MLFSLVLACLPMIDDPVDPAPTAEPPPVPTAEPPPEPTPPPAEATFTPDGGSVTFAGDITLDVPAGAVSEDTVITVTVDAFGVPSPYQGLSDLYVFGPDGLEFDVPVTVSIPHAPDADPRFFWSNGIGGFTQPVAVAGDGVMSAEITHFSMGFIAINGPVEEVRHVVPPPAVDVLFVVDDSCSMYEEQSALANNFPSFMNYFLGSGIDYHIGVTTTDMDVPAAGRLRLANGVRYIDPSTPNVQGTFSQMALAGTGGAVEERGRDAAWSLLETNRNLPANSGFWRDDAALHIVFVSDEDDQSTSITRPAFRTWMETVKARPELVKAHAITGLPQNLCGAVFDAGTDYLAYAGFTGGATFDICATDWQPFLDDMGLLASGLTRTFDLDHQAVEDTIEVRIERGTVTLAFDAEDWSYDASGPSITFVDYLPEPGDTVVIDYQPF
ncbi:MAG: hypothetical protein KC656_04405 [Myxococcales bacterium]|nr:hypothetical protein [Myxococcales bacterium]